MTQALWILVSSLLFATMGLLIKLASAHYSIAEIIFFRTFPGVLLLFAYARSRGLPLATAHWRLHAVRNVFGIGAMSLGFYAVSKLALGTAASLEYTAPIFMMLYVVMFLRHRPRAVEIVALIGGFGGVLLLLRPSLEEGQLIPFLAGLGSGICAAAAYYQLRRLGDTGEAPWRTVLIYTTFAMVVSLLALPFAPRSTYTLHGLMLLTAVGVTGLFGQLTMTRAFSQGSPTIAATLQYSTVLFAATYGFFVWNDVLTWASGTGLLLIVGSGSLAALGVRERGAG